MTGKPNRAERIIAFLEARYPGWVPAIELEPVGGRQAWRTAVSEARDLLRCREERFDPADDPLPNRTRTMRVGGEPWTLSEYRICKRHELTPAAPVAIETQGHDENAWSLR
jgi:hypothetical protein